MNLIAIIIGVIVGISLIIYLYSKIENKINLPREKLRNELNEQKKQSSQLEELLRNELNELKKLNSQLDKNITNLNHEIESLKNGIIEKDSLFENLKFLSNDSVSKITSLYADFLLVQYDISSKYLRTKKHPAIKEATRILELKSESKEYLEKFKQMLYKYEMLLQLFPELSNYVDDFESIKQLADINNIEKLQDDFDRVQFYISKEEYSMLSTSERNQLALDRYVKGQKSKWQIGRDYELYCGLLYEKDEWDVEYIGMEKKLNDMGRDLIAKKGKIHHVIQCKYWAQDKVIHEKHITQLYGTTIEYGMDFPEDIKIEAILMTNTKLSESAKRFADKLGVIIYQNLPLKEFPRIKCNVNRDEYGSESFIYHLPFDQQYDRTKINKHNEFYAYTVNEAVRAGFRRAFKYFG